MAAQAAFRLITSIRHRSGDRAGCAAKRDEHVAHRHGPIFRRLA
jgi:hypothetical protein